MLGFMSLGLIMAPFLGIIASFIVVIIFGIFTVVKINEFQKNNPESILLHRQFIDRMYNYGAQAEYYKLSLKQYEQPISAPTRDFSVFVSNTSKLEKKRILKRVADRAIKQQRRILESYLIA
ncbi:hypothetical protein COV88_02865 [Candidatus Saccharibacteria bacterium CG11_big_fil_rev_8_21_14_0_20_41_19]|nr:MAG: hypothetical protein COV88_02865 [Candidatus Saccharibacteria bacterium CG11_big_fil_rev_8_21_14_0_20_41_19]PJC29601.1 MAG: hypothetical protein CO052_02550 [Candidatus Saccharibacteria bacterium CG_4_9_14_0_2_um_filter_41_9]